MYVLENVNYEARNLVSFRRRMTALEILSMIGRKTGMITTCMYEIYIKKGEGKADTEIFIPINKKLPSTRMASVTHISLCYCVKI